ncbi:MAG: helix-turn-helix domain-containing protein [Bacteroidetes bacterium]|nr:helix-turn-helix domain-containing protein [Bacteroidota bacterium]
MAKLRILRRRQLLSQRDLARRAGIAPSTVHTIEAGKATPRLLVARKICQALGVAPQDVDEFLALIDDGAGVGSSLEP